MINRRTFLTRGAAAACFAALTPLDRGGLAQAPDVGLAATLVIEPDRVGPPIARGFLGLSYESSQVPVADFLSPANHSLLALVHRLGDEGVIRIGGNTSEFTQFQAAGAAPITAASGTRRYVITPKDIERLAAFVRTAGWRLIYGLNLGTGTPEQAAAEAEAVTRIAGDSLLAFQIGNEPDLFHSNGLRPKTYGLADYLREWQAFARAVRGRVPNAPLAGPDTASHPDWFTTLAHRESDYRVMLLTQHHYAEGPGSSPNSTIDRMLRSRIRYRGVLRALGQAARQARRPWRMSETNSCYGGGKYGVSDTLAAALWGVNYLFQLADAGCTGANFHGGEGGAYTPIARVRGTADYAPRPLYYGMLLFAQSARGHLVPAHLSGPTGTLSAYAVRDGETLSVTVINTDAAQSVRLRIDAGRRFRAGTVLRLTGPGLAATGSVTLGGATVGTDGSWTPETASERVAYEGPQIALDVPAASAAMVSLR